MENVESFPRERLQALLPMYEITYTTLTPLQFGWPVSRRRQYVVSGSDVQFTPALH